MKKKVLLGIGIAALLLVLILGITRYMEVRKCQTDSNWQVAKEFYKIENALKEVDEGYECQSVSKVTPFTYTDSEGNTIVYYCIQTAYLENESGDYTGLDMDAISLVVDLNLIKNKREYNVNEHDAYLCALGDRSYLCWTLSPEISCVIEYNADAINEDDIFRMAEIVPLLTK